MAIPTVPDCNPEDQCDALPLVSIGKAIVVVDPTSECKKILDGAGIPVQTEGEVHMADGSPTNPVKLPKMQTLDGSFPLLLVMNKAGAFYALLPNKTDKRFMLSSKNGSFVLEPLLSEPCFNNEDVCGNCNPDYIAGIRVVDGKACIVKLPLSVTVDFWESSNCIEITGSGTEEDPYIPSLKISAEAGNQVQCLADGIFVADPSS